MAIELDGRGKVALQADTKFPKRTDEIQGRRNSGRRCFRDLFCGLRLRLLILRPTKEGEAKTQGPLRTAGLRRPSVPALRLCLIADGFRA